MRVSRKVAAKNRENVVRTASRLFREHGYDGIGVAKLMKAAGLTHGGFYKQFDHKGALAVEATIAALQENQKIWSYTKDHSDTPALEAFSSWYLSERHVAARSDGCTFAALASDAARQSAEVKRVFAGSIRTFVELMREGQDEAHEKAALHQLSTIVGALILARAVGDDTLSEKILESGLPKES